MQDDLSPFETSLADLSNTEWRGKIAESVKNQGSFKTLGAQHFAAFIESKPTLLVSFETIQGLRKLPHSSHPLGWEFYKSHGWSQLTIVSDGESWFRDPQIYTYFDRLVDEGFFDNFEQVIFYGAGSCGYGAAAFSVAAPGAIVVAVQPQATLDPRVAEWDKRFVKMRRTDFTHRYGYAPDMLDAAQQAYILYDPYVSLDAAHAALFTRPNVKKLRMPYMGSDLKGIMSDMGIFSPVLEAAVQDDLTTLKFAQLMRARRDSPMYLHTLLRRLEFRKKTALIQVLCKNVTSRMNAPRFARRLSKEHHA